mmetsp:Transcript_31295/g.75293  ORF Transcript_31295/g.75293 Transcript_31295/m.75293 type:complete len:284 (+) Transcript_31295:262-1113(+)
MIHFVDLLLFSIIRSITILNLLFLVSVINSRFGHSLFSCEIPFGKQEGRQNGKDKRVIKHCFGHADPFTVGRIIIQEWIQTIPSHGMWYNEHTKPESLERNGLHVSHQTNGPVLVLGNVSVVGISPSLSDAKDTCETQEVGDKLDNMTPGRRCHAKSSYILNKQNDQEETAQHAVELFVVVTDLGNELEKVKIPPENGPNNMWDKVVVPQVRKVGFGNLIEPQCEFFFGFFHSLQIVLFIPESVLELTRHGEHPCDDVKKEEADGDKAVTAGHSCLFCWLVCW